MNPAQLLRQATAAGYDFRVDDHMLRVKPPAGNHVDMLPDIWAHDRELLILVTLMQPPPRCDNCGLIMSVNRVSITCGRCLGLHPLVREAVRMGARVTYPRSNDARYNAWRRLKLQLKKRQEGASAIDPG